MSLTESSQLEWPRFCYSGGPSLFEDGPKFDEKSVKKPGRKNSRGAKTYLPPSPYKPEELQRVPSIGNNDFTYSTLMKRMAQKYRNVDEVQESTPVSSLPSSLFSMMGFSAFSPFAQPWSDLSRLATDRFKRKRAFLSENGDDEENKENSKRSRDHGLPLDLSYAAKEEEEIDVIGTVEDWSIDRVAEFVNSVEDCGVYSETFKEHSIDGSALLVLSETHLTKILEMKLGHAIKLLNAIRRISK